MKGTMDNHGGVALKQGWARLSLEFSVIGCRACALAQNLTQSTHHLLLERPLWQ
jgi:hypothetical protein